MALGHFFGLIALELPFRAPSPFENFSLTTLPRLAASPSLPLIRPLAFQRERTRGIPSTLDYFS